MDRSAARRAPIAFCLVVEESPTRRARRRRDASARLGCPIDKGLVAARQRPPVVVVGKGREKNKGLELVLQGGRKRNRDRKRKRKQKERGVCRGAVWKLWSVRARPTSDLQRTARVFCSMLNTANPAIHDHRRGGNRVGQDHLGLVSRKPAANVLGLDGLMASWSAVRM